MHIAKRFRKCAIATALLTAAMRGTAGASGLYINSGSSVYLQNYNNSPEGILTLGGNIQVISGGAVRGYSLIETDNSYANGPAGNITITGESIYFGPYSAIRAVDHPVGLNPSGGDVLLTATNGDVELYGSSGINVSGDPSQQSYFPHSLDGSISIQATGRILTNGLFGGSVNLDAGGDIILQTSGIRSDGNDIVINADGNFRAVSANPSDYNFISTKADSYGIENAGNLSITAADIQMSNPDGISIHAFSRKTSGHVQLTATNGNIAVDRIIASVPQLYLHVPETVVGSIDLDATGNISVGALYGAVHIQSGGSVYLKPEEYSNTLIRSDGGNIQITAGHLIQSGTASGNMSTLSDEYGTGVSGNVSIEAGEIQLDQVSILTNSNVQPGDITLTATNGDVRVFLAGASHDDYGATGASQGLISINASADVEANYLIGAVSIQSGGLVHLGGSSYFPAIKSNGANVTITAAHGVTAGNNGDIDATLGSYGSEPSGDVSISAGYVDLHNDIAAYGQGTGDVAISGTIGNVTVRSIRADGLVTIGAYGEIEIASGGGVAGERVEMTNGGGTVKLGRNHQVSFIYAGESGWDVNGQVSGKGKLTALYTTINGSEIVNNGLLEIETWTPESGDVLGSLATTGDFTQDSGAFLAVELSKTTPIFAVSGTATLAGSFQMLQPEEGFVPVLGTVFEPLTFGARAGTFDSYIGLRYSADRVLRPQWTANGLHLVVSELTEGFAPGVSRVTVPAGTTVSGAAQPAGITVESDVAEGFGSVASILQSTEIGESNITVDFTDAGNFGAGLGGPLASDIFELTGMVIEAGDAFVLQLDYNEAAAIDAFGSESAMVLGWFDPTANGGLGEWVNAVLGNSDGGAQYQQFFGAYDAATMFALGNYGVDVVANRVWAVIDHNSEFGAGGGLGAVPEPGVFSLVACGLWLFQSQRRRGR